IAEGLRSINYRANARYILKCQQNGTPSQAPAVLPAVNEQLLRVVVSSPFFQTVREYQPGIGAELVFLERNHCFPQSFLALLCPQLLQHLIPFPHPADTLRSDAEIIAVRLSREVHALLIWQI